MHIKKHIPNFLTICNLLSGCFAIVFAFKGEIEVSAYLMWAAAIFDFLDGYVARWLKAYSPMGKELDSLADMVTFGLLPAVIMYSLLIGYFGEGYVPWFAFLITAFSALRLAKFNIDTRQSDSFIGLPTPANALFISALPFIINGDSIMAPFVANGYVLLTITLLFSILLVAEIRLFALKFKNFTWKDNKIKFIFLLVSLVFIAALGISAIPLIVIYYLTLSIPGSRSSL